MPEKRIYRFEEFMLDADEHLFVRGADERVNLSPRTFALLVKLVENAGHLLDKETLMREVWSDSIVEEGNLNRTISNLRKILGEKPNENRFIETVPRVGYRFIAPVSLIEDEKGRKGEKETGESEFSNSESKIGDKKIESEELKTENQRPKIENRKQKLKFLLPIAALILIAITVFSLLAWRSWKNNSANKSDKANPYEPVRLTDAPENDSHPHWTRDGRIRFFRTGAKYQTESFVMNADGSDQSVVKDFPAMKYAVWSPDEQKVIFAKHNDKTAYYLANADGSNETPLPFYAGNFHWSSDATRIVYQKTIEPHQAEIFVYSVETGESRNLTNNPAFDADPSFSPDGKQIVFISDRDGNSEIYVMNADGGDVRRLTDHPSQESHPVFSPDATVIAFTSDREGENADVYVMNADGSGNAKRLTTWATNETVEPGCWSPDGTRIAFFSDNKDKTDDIFVMSAEIFRPRKLLETEQNTGFASVSPDGKQILFQTETENKTGEIRIFDTSTKREKVLTQTENADPLPVFSPDGKKIAFQSKIEGNTEICIINADGSGFVNLSGNPAKDVSPAWSPDGARIVFASNRDGNFGLFQLYVMNADGSNQHRIYSSGGISGSPVWSPDGKEIIFSNDKEDNRSGNFEIFAIEPETTAAEKRLTFRRRYDVSPAVSPDGEHIAFVSEADGNSEIYLMSANGAGVLRVTRNPAEDVSPRWSPDGRKIIFSSNRDGKFAVYEIEIF